MIRPRGGIFHSDPDLDMKCLGGLCTDGAPAMLGRQQGFVAHVNNFVAEENSNNNGTSIHCIIHEEALCAKVTDLCDALSQVKQIIICIRSNVRRRRQFPALLDDSVESLEDVLYYTPVRWLTQGQTTCRVLNLRREISTFNVMVTLAFLADVLA